MRAPLLGTLVLVDRLHVAAQPVLTFLRRSDDRAVWDAWPEVPLSATQWRPPTAGGAPPVTKLRRRAA